MFLWFYFYTYYIISQVTDGDNDLAPLIELVHHRWNLPVLAELYRRNGAKFVTLVHALGVGRASLSASLNHLIELGLVRKNPGHGHPMRPEYLLTAFGRAVGEHCWALTKVLGRPGERELAFRKWTLPLVAAIGEEVRRFGDVQNALPDATPRAITLGLKALTGAGWATRSIVDDYPPTAGYRLLTKGRRILTRVGELWLPIAQDSRLISHAE